MTKPRSDSVLLNLPEEQQALLAEWLMNGMPYHVARAQVENEFGRTVKSLSSFSAFWDEVCQPILLSRRSRAMQTSETLAGTLEQNELLDKGLITMIKQKAFEICMQPGADPDAVSSLVSGALKLRDQDLKQKDLQIRRDKFEWDAAAACLKDLPALKAIATNPALDNNGKINAIRAKLFGQLPVANA
jgi:hypothetical protein